MKYQYKILNTNKTVEIEQSIKDNTLTSIDFCKRLNEPINNIEDNSPCITLYGNCEKCSQRTQKEIERIITGGCGFVLKGSGWAKDNYSKQRIKE
jgi:predicted nucleic acid-binding Zn ribbon protein